MMRRRQKTKTKDSFENVILPVMRETWVQPLGWEDPLKKGTANNSSILAWRIPWTEEPGRLQYMGWKSQTCLSNFHFSKQYNTMEFL